MGINYKQKIYISQKAVQITETAIESSGFGSNQSEEGILLQQALETISKQHQTIQDLQEKLKQSEANISKQNAEIENLKVQLQSLLKPT